MYGFTKREGKSCWCANSNDGSQFIQAGSTIPLMFYAVGTMGDPGSDPRITSYYIMYTVDGSVWEDYKNKQAFTANTVRNSKVENDLEDIIAVSIKLHPLTWSSGICLKIEAYFISV